MSLFVAVSWLTNSTKRFPNHDLDLGFRNAVNDTTILACGRHHNSMPSTIHQNVIHHSTTPQTSAGYPPGYAAKRNTLRSFIHFNRS